MVYKVSDRSHTPQVVGLNTARARTTNCENSGYTCVVDNNAIFTIFICDQIWHFELAFSLLREDTDSAASSHCLLAIKGIVHWAKGISVLVNRSGMLRQKYLCTFLLLINVVIIIEWQMGEKIFTIRKIILFSVSSASADTDPIVDLTWSHWIFICFICRRCWCSSKVTAVLVVVVEVAVVDVRLRYWNWRSCWVDAADWIYRVLQVLVDVYLLNGERWPLYIHVETRWLSSYTDCWLNDDDVKSSYLYKWR